MTQEQLIERAEDIRRMIKERYTYKEAAQKYKISKQRAWAIANKKNGTA